MPRLVISSILILGLLVSLLAGPSLRAQRAGGEAPSRFMDRIDSEEGERRLAAFRRQRLEGDYCFAFELAQKPFRGRTTRYQGLMWGSWNDRGPVSRIRLFAPGTEPGRELAAGSNFAVELIIQNGPRAEVWLRRSAQASFAKLEGAERFAPLIDGMLYRPFDLQMPFIYWPEFRYEGPRRVGATRVAQQFLMLPPEGSFSEQLGIQGVRVGLDEIYNALWRIEIVDADGELQSQFAVESFQKVQDQYIVKRISLRDFVSRDRTTFSVESAAVGLRLDDGIFDPKGAAEVDLPIPTSLESL